jgi:methionyl-tRNA formyltransferase
MRFGFVTCVQLGLSCMEAIYEVGGRLDLALTLHDDQAVAKSGRVWIDDFCAARSIPLVKARNINHDESVAAIEEAGLDWLFIVGWSQIARERVLAAPRCGVLGMHPTLLPEGRGRAAIPWAILKGLERTGVTLFRLDSGVDTGDILDQAEIRLGPDTGATELYAQVEAAHVALMQSAYPKLVAGTLEPRRQDESRASEWPGRKPEDGRIDRAGSVRDAERLVRAVTRPYPGAFVEQEEGRRLVVWKARIVASPAECGAAPCLAFHDGYLCCTQWEEQGAAEGS